jgi:HlyD family secretion protein
MTKKKIFISIGVIAVIFILLAVFGKKDKKGIMVATEKVSLRNIVEEVTASGTIYPESEVKISPDVSGEIIDLYVQEGDTVKKGQLLVRINPDIYQTQLEQAKAGLNNAKATSANIQAQLLRTKSNVELQRKNFEMQEKLFKEKVISQQEYNTAEAQYEMSRAELQAAEKQALASQYNTQSVEASVNQAGKTYNRTSVIAPTDGVITGLVSKRGERVVGTAQMAGTEMMRISDLSRMEVRVEVNENDIVRINVGDSAGIEVDAYDGKKFRGIVTQVANSSKNSSTTISTEQVTKYEVKVLILKSSYEAIMAENNGKMPFRPGMSSTVHIYTKTESNVLTVPVAAITLKEKSDNSGEKEEVVFVVVNGKAVKKVVKTGIQDTRFIKILEGLKKDEEVISAPYEAINFKISDGGAVNVVDKEKLYEAVAK